jgi:hypothetical protein
MRKVGRRMTEELVKKDKSRLLVESNKWWGILHCAIIHESKELIYNKEKKKGSSTLNRYFLKMLVSHSLGISSLTIAVADQLILHILTTLQKENIDADFKTSYNDILLDLLNVKYSYALGSEALDVVFRYICELSLYTLTGSLNNLLLKYLNHFSRRKFIGEGADIVIENILSYLNDNLNTVMSSQSEIKFLSVLCDCYVYLMIYNSTNFPVLFLKMLR